jgi:predicted RNA-binding Zn ribbon-like protein
MTQHTDTTALVDTAAAILAKLIRLRETISWVRSTCPTDAQERLAALRVYERRLEADYAEATPETWCWSNLN